MTSLLVTCHPDPASFTQAVAAGVRESLAAAGQTTDAWDLYADGFDASEVERLAMARHLVLVYPTWWSGFPAMLKDWLDQLWVPLSPGSRCFPNIVSITAITSHGSSKWTNLLEGETGRLLLKRALKRATSPRCRTRWVPFYGIDTADSAARTAFIERAARAVSQLG